jgi:hypothetical protein
MIAKKRRIARNIKIRQLSKFFIECNKLMTEQEYSEVSKLKKPQTVLSINIMFGTYEKMLKELELGPLAKEVIALKPKPKPKPAVKKPKAPAKPLVVKPAKVKESKDE